MRNYKIFVAICCLACIGLLQAKPVFAQSSITDTNAYIDRSPRIKEHSPTKATLLSLVPGLGQAYNKQYWKMPIIYAAMGTLTYLAVQNYNGYSRLRTEYGARMNNDTLKFNPTYKNYSTTSVYNLKDAYQSAFELDLIIGGAIYVINLLDACVYAHLFTFTISDDVSLQMMPSIQKGNFASKFPYETGVSFRLHFK